MVIENITIENLTAIEPVAQLLMSYQGLLNMLKIVLGGIFGFIVLTTVIRIVQNMHFSHRLKRIQRDIEDIKERLGAFEEKEDAR